MDIKIERLTDSYDCETCGSSWAEGARIFIDGALAFELTPHARCYDGDDYSDDQIFAKVLEHLGHTVSYVAVD